MKNSNLKNTIIFIDKKAELEGKGKVPKLNLRKLGNDAKIIGYQEHKKIKIHEAKKQKFLNSKFYKFRKKASTHTKLKTRVRNQLRNLTN